MTELGLPKPHEPIGLVMLHQSKPWYESMGVLGPLVALMAMLLQLTGITGIDPSTAVHFAAQGIELAGVILGLIGRIRARKRVRLL
jgi:hypothetical protein